MDKKLFAEGSRRKKIVCNDNNTKNIACIDEMSIPSSKKIMVRPLLASYVIITQL
jgi:hypothetical protein